MQGVKQGTSVLYYRGKHKSLEVEYSDGTKNGHYAEWYADGRPKNDRTYKDGTLNGDFTEWHPDGSLKAEGHYKDGGSRRRLEGVVARRRRPSPKGRYHVRRRRAGRVVRKLVSHWTTANDRETLPEAGGRNGLATDWFENGNKKAEGTFEDDTPNGRFMMWYESGAPKGVSDFRMGRKHGDAYEWAESGEVTSSVKYDHGVAK